MPECEVKDMHRLRGPGPRLFTVREEDTVIRESSHAALHFLPLHPKGGLSAPRMVTYM